MPLQFNQVSFTYPQTDTMILDHATASFPIGWTGVIGANGTGKSTLLHLAAGILTPSKGSITTNESIVFCPQRTDEMPEELPAFVQDWSADACVLRGKLSIDEEWASRWDSLSHGERKRAQIGVALWKEPTVLLVDEPTNHIDHTAKQMLLDVLQQFSGTGLIVSHDRELLDTLCQQCLLIDPPTISMYSGSYSQVISCVENEKQALQNRKNILKGKMQKLVSEEQRRRSEAGMADKKKSKGNLARNDSDGRGKINLAIVTGKDGQAGRLTRQIQNRVARAKEEVDSVHVSKSYDVKFWMNVAECPRRQLITVPAGELSLGQSRKLHYPELTIFRKDRIAITGNNGLGKSTFIRALIDNVNMEEDHILYMEQEISLSKTRMIMQEFAELSNQEKGEVMTIVSCLGSRPQRLLANTDVSPGELRKLLLAMGIIKSPYLIIMDEPTNHLDLPAIEALENALKDCTCGLILVSHDQQFLNNLTDIKWDFREQNGDVSVCVS